MKSQSNIRSAAPPATAADHQRLYHANASANSDVHHTSSYRGAGGGHLGAQSINNNRLEVLLPPSIATPPMTPCSSTPNPVYKTMSVNPGYVTIPGRGLKNCDLSAKPNNRWFYTHKNHHHHPRWPRGNSNPIHTYDRTSSNTYYRAVRR